MTMKLPAFTPAQESLFLTLGGRALDSRLTSPFLGDTMADLGQLLVYWTEPGEISALAASPTTAPGFPTRLELAERYADVSGRSIAELDFYVAFAYWKVACILEGVYTRYVAGAMGSDGFDFHAGAGAGSWMLLTEIGRCTALDNASCSAEAY